MGTGSFSWGKAAGAWRYPPPSSAEVKGRIELYLYSHSGPSWPVVRRILLLLYLYFIVVIIISFMQGIYTYIPETNYVPREYSVAAVLLFLFMVHTSLAPVLNL
jgi:hypothetical protein